VNLGDAFTNAPAPGIPTHLWFVVSNPSGAGRIAIVNVSSDNGGRGCLIALAPGEHPWLHHPSFIRTDMAMLAERAKLQTGVARMPPVLFMQATTPAATLRKLQQALLDCQHTRREIKTALTTQGLP
jgi:hypothetical protein